MLENGHLPAASRPSLYAPPLYAFSSVHPTPMIITVTPASGQPVQLVVAGDVVTGLDLGDDTVVETVRLFRRDRAISRPRGGQLDTLACSVERVHASYAAAVAYAAALRRTLRALAMAAPLAVTVVIDGTSPVTLTYAAASVRTSGVTRIQGVRTIQAFNIQGALAD